MHISITAIFVRYLFTIIMIFIIITSSAQITQPGVVVYNRTPLTQDWLIPAWLSCLFCFWPLGLMAVMAASKVNITWYPYTIVQTCISDKCSTYEITFLYNLFCIILQYVPCNVTRKDFGFVLALRKTFEILFHFQLLLCE